MQVISFSLQYNIMQLHWKGSIASTLVWWLFKVSSRWSSCNWVGCDYAAYKDLLIMRRKKIFWLCKDHCTHTQEAWGFKWQLEKEQWGIFGFWTQLWNQLRPPQFEVGLSARFKDADKTLPDSNNKPPLFIAVQKQDSICTNLPADEFQFSC